MSHAAAAESFESLIWTFLDPDSSALQVETEQKLATRWQDPGAVRRFVELCLDHVLLHDLLQEKTASKPLPAGLTDAELVKQADDGVPGAFDVLVERYFNMVAAAAYALLSDAEAARDVAQESFLEAAQGLPMLRERDKFANWVYGIARRKAIYTLRRRKLHQSAILIKQEQARAQPDKSDPRLPIVSTERNEVVRQALARLPEIYREVLILRYMDGRSAEEITTILGLSTAAVEKRLARAKSLLREHLQKWIED
jgi:RNA polymerase sigma-70 factor (ECF subfamily)